MVFTGGRLDYCQVCFRAVPRQKLRYRKIKQSQPEGNNYIPYSEYNALGWTLVGTGSKVTDDCYGVHYDPRWNVFDINNNPTKVNAAATFEGEVLLVPSAAVDVSTWTDFVFSVFIGPLESDESAELTITTGLCQSDGSGAVTYTTRKAYGGVQPYFHRSVIDVISPFSSSGIYPFFKVSPAASDSQWWFEHARLEKNLQIPSTIVIKTSGSSVSYSADSSQMVIAKVCPRCVELIVDDEEVFP
jgi:hypothetical protein